MEIIRVDGIYVGICSLQDMQARTIAIANGEREPDPKVKLFAESRQAAIDFIRENREELIR